MSSVKRSVELLNIDDIIKNLNLSGGNISAYDFSKKLQEKYVLYTIHDKIFMYNETTGLYEEITSVIELLTLSILKQRWKPSYPKLMYKILMVEANKSLPPTLPENFIPFWNGVLNLRNKEFIKFTSNYFLTSKIPIIYDPNQTCSTFLKLSRSYCFNIDTFYVWLKEALLWRWKELLQPKPLETEVDAYNFVYRWIKSVDDRTGRSLFKNVDFNELYIPNEFSGMINFLLTPETYGKIIDEKQVDNKDE